jgi:flagellar hook-associated protein 1 FlgK
MTLSLAGLIANESLGAVSAQTGIVSRNISGASVQGYSAKIPQLVTSDHGTPSIVGVARQADSALLKSLLAANAEQAGSTAVSDGLRRIEQFLNVALDGPSAVDSSASPAAAISNLSSALQAYSASPNDPIAADNALARAKDLAKSLNGASGMIQDVRQQADQSIQQSVAHVNDVLAKFERVNKDIVVGMAAKADVTDMLDERDRLLSELSTEIGIATVQRPSGDMVIYTDGGVTLFEMTPRAVSFQPTPSFAAATPGAGVQIDGVRVVGAPNSQLAARSGRLVGLAQLRDELAPRFQTQVDEVARGLVQAFSESDQTGSGAPTLPGLFTYDGATVSPGPGAITGLAARIIVNPTVDPAQGGDSSRLRDGGASSPGAPEYVYNATGASGFSDRLLQLVDALAAPQAFDAAAGLRLQDSVASFAADSMGWLAAQRQQVETKQTFQSAVVNQTSQALSNASGVNLDDQMSKMLALENSYQASAKLLAAVNAMYSTLFEAIRV